MDITEELACKLEGNPTAVAAREEILKLREALFFYAHPETYFAIAFFPDPPCGDFVKDFSEVGDWGARPGKLAREALCIEED